MTTQRRPPEYKQLLVVLDEKIRGSGRARKDLEAELGWKPGTLRPVLAGKREMEVDELEQLCDALGFEPLSVVVEATKRAAILGVGERIAARTLQELQATLRSSVQQEIDLFLREGPGTPP